MHESLDVSTESAARALYGLFGWAAGAGGEELLEISVKSPGGKWRAQHLEPATLWSPGFVAGVREWSVRGRECYVGCVSLTGRPDKPWRRGGAALRSRAAALWLDVDCQAPGRDSAEFFTGVDEAVENVDKALGMLARAALVVGSGWGVQYWLPLSEPVTGVEASQGVRALVGVVAELTGKKIDRVWDVTRVMRMPGTYNWRAGDDESDGVPTGVLRWPDPEFRGDGRLGYLGVVDALAARVGVHGPECLENLLARYAEGAGGVGGAAGGGSGGPIGEWLGDLSRIADEVLSWPEVLEPAGWRCVSGRDGLGHEQVWERPGKDGHGEVGERSAVVYADRPELLVVYSDSPDTGFSAGLRGGGHRGDAAGVGVIDRWRAWVDLAWGGVRENAEASVRSGGEDPVGRALAAGLGEETGWVAEWASDLTLEALDRAGGEIPPPW